MKYEARSIRCYGAFQYEARFIRGYGAYLKGDEVTIDGVTLQATGDCLEERFPDGSGHIIYIFVGNSTPYGCCRDCGDYWIIARRSGYDKIDKFSRKVESGVEDK